MAGKRERGIHELYGDDPERADALVFGRRTGPTRRGFLGGAGLAAMGAAVGGSIPFAGNMPAGLVPAALAQAAPAADAPKVLKMDGKAELVILGDRPLVAETPPHMLDDDVTPTDKMYIRNNGQIPQMAANADAWTLTIDGEVNTPLKITLGELKQRFQSVTLPMQLECGGNGRSAFSPKASGNAWTVGAIGNPTWTGVRLKDVLQAAGLKPSATYTAHYGADPHLSGEAGRDSISRGVRLEKAMEEHSLLVYQINGQPLPNIHGFPLRLVYPGWPGSASHKWLTRIWIRDKEHDGQGMTATSYRVPIAPMIPGSQADNKNMRILESMPLRSIITSPAEGTRLPSGTRQLAVRGKAWAGENTVRQVDVSIDYGQSWVKADLKAAPNKYAWQSWTANVPLPTHGYYEIWSRATDNNGLMQAFTAQNWNPQGYGGNAYHRVAVLAQA